MDRPFTTFLRTELSPVSVAFILPTLPNCAVVGSGTLLHIGGHFFVLTAAHVGKIVDRLEHKGKFVFQEASYLDCTWYGDTDLLSYWRPDVHVGSLSFN